MNVERLGDRLVEALTNPQTADLEMLRLLVNDVEAQAGRVASWTDAGGGLSVPSITAGVLDVSQQSFPWATLGSGSANHQTLTHDTWTTITGMSAYAFSRGLKVDTTDYSYIEFGNVGVPGKSLIVLNAVIPFETSSTADRELRIQYYDETSAAWGSSYNIGKVRAEANGETIPPGTFMGRVLSARDTRIRVQAKQTSGGDLDIHIPFVNVLVIP